MKSNTKEEWILYDDQDNRLGSLKYRCDTKTKNLIINKLLDWYIEQECYHGELMCQNDDCQADAINVLSAIADELFQFEYEEEDN